MSSLSNENKSRLVREAKKTDFWNKVFLPLYQDLHDNLEEWAFSSKDMYQRAAYIEGVKALRTLMIQVNDLENEVKPSPHGAVRNINELDSGHLED